MHGVKFDALPNRNGYMDIEAYRIEKEKVEYLIDNESPHHAHEVIMSLSVNSFKLTPIVFLQFSQLKSDTSI